MARSKSKTRIYAEAIPTFTLLSALRCLPWAWSEAILTGLARLLFLFIPKRRRLAKEHLSLCFPAMTAAQRDQTARQSVDYLAKGLNVFIRMETSAVVDDHLKVKVEGLHHLETALAKNRGILVFTAHYGCWEMSLANSLQFYPKIAAIYRPLDNPLIDHAVARVRTANGARVIPRRQALRQGLPWLRDKGILAVIVDQNFPAGGVYVDFFGRLAATTPIVSILSQRTGAPVLPIHSRWVGDTLHILWGEPLAPSALTNPKDACADDTQRMTKVVEEWIREDPAQWLWLHNRWKKRPDENSWVWNPK